MDISGLAPNPCYHEEQQAPMWLCFEFLSLSLSLSSLPPTWQERGQKLQQTMQDLEMQGLEAVKEMLAGGITLDPEELEDLFFDCIDTEIKFYK